LGLQRHLPIPKRELFPAGFEDLLEGLAFVHSSSPFQWERIDMRSAMRNTLPFAILSVSMTAATLLMVLMLFAQRGVAQVPQINQPLVPGSIAPENPYGFTLKVNGTGFTPSSVVMWNGSARATTLVSSTKLLATITATDVDSPGTVTVTVMNSQSTSNVAYFDVTNPTSSVSFAKTDYATGDTPYFVTTADLNGDGKLDLVVPNLHGNNISVLLGNGDGSFQAAVNYAAGSLPGAVAIGDFNDDGKLDLAVTNTGSSTVSVFLGNGDGTFQSAVNYGVGSWPTSIAAGDFNGDGKLDLAITNFFGNNVMVLLGNGDGTFQSPSTYTAGNAPGRVGVGDFNGDGKLDLAITNTNDNSVSVLLGNGDGTFQAALTSPAGPTGPGLSSLSVADLNGDGMLDVVVAHYATNVTVLLGKGDGSFQAPVDYAAGSGAWWTTLADLDGDGKLDLAVANANSNTISVLLGKGDGTFQAAVDYPADTQPFGIVAGDFNADGRMDLAVPNAGSGNVSLLLQPTPTFGFAQLIGGNTFTGNQTVNGNVAASFFFGNGSGLTNLNPANLAPGTAGINITGTAANATNLGGVAAGNYARLDIGNSFTGNQGIAGNISASGSVAIGGGTPILKHLSITATLSVPSIKPSSCTSSSFTLAGASNGDTTALGVPNALMTAGTIVYSAWVSAPNTIVIRACDVNPNGPATTAASGTIRVDLWKH
jgi:hypothetical protein